MGEYLEDKACHHRAYQGAQAGCSKSVREGIGFGDIRLRASLEDDPEANLALRACAVVFAKAFRSASFARVRSRAGSSATRASNSGDNDLPQKSTILRGNVDLAIVTILSGRGFFRAEHGSASTKRDELVSTAEEQSNNMKMLPSGRRSTSVLSRKKQLGLIRSHENSENIVRHTTANA